MGAFVEKNFSKGFVLDETRLRKIKDTIENRLSQCNPPREILYKVTRGDAYSYETNSIEHVISEDNEDWRAITRLEIFCADVEGFDFKLWFSSSGVNMLISGNDRDFVFLLFSDLRAYIKNEVLVGFGFSRSAELTFVSILMLLAVFYVYYDLSSPLQIVALEKALASSSEIEKLNYIIELTRRKQSTLIPLGFLLFVMALMVFSVGGVWRKIMTIVFPQNVFLFGSAKERSERRKAVLEKVVWVVVVGLIVSLVASYIFSYFQRI